MIRTFSVLALLAGLATATPAQATDIKIGEFVGKVTIVEGRPGISVERDGRFEFEHGMEAGEIFIYSNLDWRDIKDICNGKASKKDLPEVRISAPDGANLFIDESYLHLDVGIDLDKADLELGGCFDVRLRDVDDLFYDKSGSGETIIGDTRKLDINKSGSGNMEAGRTERLFIDKSGSGSVKVGAVAGPVTIDRSGTGLIDIRSANGDVRIEQSGSGDVAIRGGRVGDLDVDISGSGDIDIDAPVKDAFVSASGSSQINLEAVSGNIRQSTSGSSKVRVGGR